MATILTGSTYAYTFNIPRTPQRHQLVRRALKSPMRRIWAPLEAIPTWDPRIRFDLLHSFNKIPLTRKPWIVSFEDKLPHTVNPKDKWLRKVLRERLLDDECKAIISISQYALRYTREWLGDWSSLDRVLQKTIVVHPNVESVEHARPYRKGLQLQVLFVGNQFARKGGIVMLRMAKLALQKRLPIRFHIVSTLEYAGDIYMDAPSKDVYSEDIKLMNLANVVWHKSLPNISVLKLTSESHFMALPTLHDTYGYSVLEGMSAGVPALASATCAVPENVEHGKTGYLLPIEVNALGDWIHRRKRNLDTYPTLLSEAFDRMANAGIVHLENIVDNPSTWEELSLGATEHIRKNRWAPVIGGMLEDIYSKALGS